MRNTQPPGIQPLDATAPDDDIVIMTGLRGGFRSSAGEYLEVLHGIDLSIRRREMTAVVGETGSGKTLTALAIIGLTPPRFQRTGGSIVFDGCDLAGYSERQLNQIRGVQIAMVFQQSRSALNPVFTVGTQLSDVFRLHHGYNKKGALVAAEEMLARVKVTEPSARLRQYPFELSGGTAQRVQLALALACRPVLLILDEPTTGLDVTIQADILDLIVELNRDLGMSTCMITHDLGVVAETCDNVVVMRAGEVREAGTCEQIMTRPADSYTRELLAASRVGSGAR